MKTKDKKVAEWKRRKIAPVITEHIHDNLTAGVAVRGTLTITDGKADTQWDNDPRKWKYA